jgi:ketosteroid isomerase-like protein
VEQGLSPDDRERIVREINRTLDDYKDAVMRKELSAVKGFWSDADDFVFAGDGTILGGSREWYDKLDWYDQDTDKWNSWEWRNVHVEPLAMDAASATLEFENSRTTRAGETVRIKGAWTYVFKKYDGKWRVIQTNGTHVPF